MLLKNFLINLIPTICNIIFLYSIVTITISVMFLYSNTLRVKFIYIIFIILLLSFWGFCYYLDGFMLMFLLTEITLIFFFIIMYTQIYSNNSFNNTLKFKKLLISILFLLIVYSSVNSISYSGLVTYTNYYTTTAIIITCDFFILYSYFFNMYSTTLILLILIMGFISLFFILLYFSIKHFQQKNITKEKTINLIRKQSLVGQSQNLTKIRIFKK